ncbi:unnamed protein product [Closterium sp. Naga37s-1]|nr:unnamed protein product [Closterium sp. Naga37s-1]
MLGQDAAVLFVVLGGGFSDGILPCPLFPLTHPASPSQPTLTGEVPTTFLLSASFPSPHHPPSQRSPGGKGAATAGAHESEGGGQSGRQVTKQQRQQELTRAKEAGRCSAKLGLFNSWSWEGGFADGFLAWEPQPDKYILMDCQRNQVSNRIRCIRNYLIVAGVLNRTLVAPFRPAEVNGSYDRRVFFDLTHALTFTDANLPPDHSINITDIKKIGDLIFPSADVIAMGDLGASLFDDAFHKEIDVPFFRRPGCPNKLAIQPHPAIFEAASRFVSDVILKGMNSSAAESSRGGEEQGNNTAAEDTLPSAIAAAGGNTTTTSTSGSSGKNAGKQYRYMAIHWRRKDLVTSFQDSGSHLTINRTARCIADRMARSGNLSTVFLATDAEPAEVAELTGAVLSLRPDLRLMQLSPNLDAQAWAQVLLPYRFEHAGVVRVTLDKAVCALADVFLGTAASSFSEDIQRIRTGLRVATCEDQMLCEDEL